jgi:hypothetical protein
MSNADIRGLSRSKEHTNVFFLSHIVSLFDDHFDNLTLLILSTTPHFSPHSSFRAPLYRYSLPKRPFTSEH